MVSLHILLAERGSHSVARGIGVFERQPQAWTRQVRLQRTVYRGEDAVEEHMFDTGVIVEIFDMPHPRQGTAGMRVQRRPAMR
jgi:hypothetical protein